MSTQSKKSEEMVRQYAEGLRTLDLSKIAPILAPEFKFTYRLGNAWGGGHRITTDTRYIGYLYKAFTAMKNADIHEIKTGFCELECEGAQFLSVKLFPPHDRRILFPRDFQIREQARAQMPLGEAILLPRVKEGLLCKVECFNSMNQFLEYHRGKVLGESI